MNFGDFNGNQNGNLNEGILQGNSNGNLNIRRAIDSGNGNGNGVATALFLLLGELVSDCDSDRCIMGYQTHLNEMWLSGWDGRGGKVNWAGAIQWPYIPAVHAQAVPVSIEDLRADV